MTFAPTRAQPPPVCRPHVPKHKLPTCSGVRHRREPGVGPPRWCPDNDRFSDGGILSRPDVVIRPAIGRRGIRAQENAHHAFPYPIHVVVMPFFGVVF